MPLKLSRRQYAEMFGPTTGDRVRLADTELFVQVERDLIANDVSRAKRAEVIDKMAAAYILQGALDRLQRRGVAP